MKTITIRIFLRTSFIIGIAALCGVENVTAQKNLTQLSHFSFAAGNTCAGVWFYVDSLNREYALVGTRQGLAIVDVTQPATPSQLFLIPGNISNWREVRTWGKFAYVTTEAADINDSTKNGLQILDLSYLPDSVSSKIWKGDGAITNLLQKAHSVNVENGYVYINGSNLASGGVVIANLIDPWNPQYTGQYNAAYVHDCFVRGDTMWTSELSGGFSVVNIANRANPVAIASQPTPYQFNHNGALSDDNKYFFTTDEVHNAPVASFDVSNIFNITLLDTYRCINMDSFEVHNVRYLNDYLICPSYGSQVTIVDVKRPANMIEVGNFTTGTGLCWDAIPYLPSGNIIATDKANGLFVFAPTYVRACYLEGTVKDSITTQVISNAQVEIVNTTASAVSSFTGDYKTGIAEAGTYCVQFSAQGYGSKVVRNVTLINGEVTILDVALSVNGSSLECEETVEQHYGVFPNPVSSTAVIRFNGLSSSVNNVFFLYDVMGKKVSETKITDTAEFIFERKSLSRGIYIYKVMSGDNIFAVDKIVID